MFCRILVNNGLFTTSYWRWMPVLVLIGYWALFTGLTFIALQYFPGEWLQQGICNSNQTSPLLPIGASPATKELHLPFFSLDSLWLSHSGAVVLSCGLQLLSRMHRCSVRTTWRRGSLTAQEQYLQHCRKTTAAQSSNPPTSTGASSRIRAVLLLSTVRGSTYLQWTNLAWLLLLLVMQCWSAWTVTPHQAAATQICKVPVWRTVPVRTLGLLPLLLLLLAVVMGVVLLFLSSL